MGSFLTKVSDALPSLRQRVKVLLLGLDSTGKSSILYRLQKGRGDKIRIIPIAICCNVEITDYKAMTIYSWDIGGCLPYRDLMNAYIPQTDGLIYVVDANDKERLEFAKNELSNLTNPNNNNNFSSTCPILILANKIDLTGETGVLTVLNALDLTTLKNRPWHIQGTSAYTGQGLEEGLEWLMKTLRKNVNNEWLCMCSRFEQHCKCCVIVCIGLY